MRTCADKTGLAESPKDTGLAEAPKDTGLTEVAKRAGDPPYETPENWGVAKRARTTRPSATHLRIELMPLRAKELRHSWVEVSSPWQKRTKGVRKEERRKKIHLAERLHKRTAASENHEVQTAHA